MIITPRDKAYELIHKHYDKIDGADVIWLNVLNKWLLAKQCALITVDEIIREYNKCFIERITGEAYETYKDYWEEVKKEIEKL